MKKLYGILIVATMLVGGCSVSDERTKGDAEVVATDFARHFFNWQYEEAMENCAPESEKWIRLLASNVSESDVKMLREGDEATVSIEHLDLADMTDSVAVASVEVRDFLVRDSIGGQSEWVDEGTFHFVLVHRDGRWLVKMEGLPQSEK